jgi:SAM-dependent methyltransferase
MKITNFNKEYLQYLFPQRTRLTTEYALTLESPQEEVDSALTQMVTKDYSMIEKFLPESANNTLDIGCGIGLINLPIYEKYNRANIHLLDKTELDATKISGFNETYKFYNSMDAARNTLIANGVEKDHIHLHEATDYSSLYNVSFDLIYSFLSCGWHYPVKTYIDLMTKTLVPGGILILDIRHNTNQLQVLEQDFTLVEQVYNYAESKHTGGNIGDRYVFRRKA